MVPDHSLCPFPCCAREQKVNENPTAAPEEDDDDEGEQVEADGEHADSDGEENGEGSEDDDADAAPSFAAVTRAYVWERFSLGSTLQVLQPQRFSLRLLRLLSHLERCFGGLCASNAYLTPPSSQGLALHNDDVEVFACQTEGEKEWRLYAPLDPLAREHSRDYRQEEVGQETHRIVLKPGDLLYLPRGVIHQADTHSRGGSQSASSSSAASSAAQHSLHVTISCYQRTSWFDFLRVSVDAALERMWQRSLDVRRGLPVGFLRFVGTASAHPEQSAEQRALVDAFSARHDALLRSLLDHVDLPAAGDAMAQDFFLHRLPPLPVDAANAPLETAAATAVDSDADEERWSEWLVAEAEEKYDVGERPTSAGQRVRLLHADHIHCSVVERRRPLATAPQGGRPEEEAERPESVDEDGDGDDPTGPHVVLSHSLHNDPRVHMDSRHPPAATASLRLPFAFASPLLTLVRRAPSFVTISELGAAGLALSAQLWSLALLECRAPECDRLGKEGAKMRARPDESRKPTASWQGEPRASSHRNGM